MKNFLLLGLALNYFIGYVNASSAIAYSASYDRSVTAINRANEQEAIDAVLDVCQKKFPDCKLLGSSKGGGYGAIAISKKNGSASYVLSAITKKDALQHVLKKCNRQWGNCTITDSWQDVGRIVEVPAERRTGPFGIILGCTNPNTKLGDPECDGIDLGGHGY